MVLGASAMTTLGTLPVFLLSSQSVFVRRDLGFDERLFGVVVSAFFASAAAAALLGGGLVDRLGRRRGTVLAGLMAATGGLSVALLVDSWVTLLPAMVLLGMTNAACQVTANLTMARAVPSHRRGLGFGVKQAAIPLAITLSGLAVPLVGAVVGWRWTFGVTGCCGLLLAAWGLRIPRGTGAARAGGEGSDQPPWRALLITTVAIMCASAAANSLGSFIASWGFQVGLTPSQAGTLMAVGSGLNIVVRVTSGHLADRRHGRNLPVVAIQMGIGAVALACLAVPAVPVVVPAGLVAFALGWSWPGLLLYAVVRVGRDAPARASGWLQAGAFAGGAAGPAVFGVVVGAAGYQAAWLGAAALFAIASLLILVARRVFIADLVARPPVVPLGFGGGRGAAARTTGRAEGQP
jgi:MFS family permease